MKLKRFNVYTYKGTKYTLIGFTRDKSMIPTRVWIETTQGNKIEIDRIKFESEAEFIKTNIKPKQKRKKRSNETVKRKVIVKRYDKFVKECDSIKEAVIFTNNNYTSVYKCLNGKTANKDGYSYMYKQQFKYELYIADEKVGNCNTIKEAKKILKCSRETFESLISGMTVNEKSVKVG